MSTALPLRGMAVIFCGVDGLSREAIEPMTQQLRGLHARGLLNPSSSGPRDAWLFDVYEACKARLLLELIDIGLAGERVKQAFSAFDFDTEYGTQRSTMLAAAMNRATANKECVLKVEVFNKPGAAHKEIAADFDWPGRRTKTAQRILDAGRIGEKKHSLVTIPATDLLRPIIQKFREMG